jgi:hypothetical protein
MHNKKLERSSAFSGAALKIRANGDAGCGLKSVRTPPNTLNPGLRLGTNTRSMT